jgi:hypothetical protein
MWDAADEPVGAASANGSGAAQSGAANYG